MKKITYYPGCTLKTAAANFEESAIEVMKIFDIELEELTRWNCCGTVFSLATDDLIHHLAAIRNLIRVKEQKSSQVMTLCAMCYNTLKRSNQRMKDNSEDLEKINDFMYKEDLNYDADVEVLHLLPYLRDEVTYSEIEKKVKKPLNGLKVSAFYGCTLLRPQEVQIDDPFKPTILENLITTIGGEPIDSPYIVECCGAYQTVNQVDIVVERTNVIINGASKQGAEAIVTSCPLCAFNLDQRQKETKDKYSKFSEMPIFYFTELLAYSLGIEFKKKWQDLHYIDPLSLLDN
ncbi:MAG: CoB--CoM heterodisulfide reductase iron-sulfur subunit B family protein [Candidatus Cloacimonetes bacterium]|nr:CoB--CoM heterodisulfide reductase iron-sulfur subunit B family protein [Candidatus Cloacimonadota bacterium]